MPSLVTPTSSTSNATPMLGLMFGGYLWACIFDVCVRACACVRVCVRVCACVCVCGGVVLFFVFYELVFCLCIAIIVSDKDRNENKNV